MSIETLCTGCGTTVAPTKVFGLLHDADGMMHCQIGPNKGNTHSVELSPVAIKSEAALTPLEKEMLSALKELVRMVDGILQGYGVLEEPMKVAKNVISKAEAVQS